MKKITMPVCFAAFLALGVGCGNSQTSDTSTTTDSSSTMGSSMSSAADSVKSDVSNAGSAVAGAASAGAASVSGSKDTSMADDRKFVLEAASGGLMEVELGKLAQANGSSAQVKEFGRMMVTDHTKANTQLKAVAAAKNITVPPAPADKEQKHIDDLKSKKGADFDKAYVDMMVDDHKEDISKFEDESKNGNDAAVKSFATKTLPVLNKHLEHINTIQSAMKK